MAIKNFWSLNVDEAIVADKLQNDLKLKGYELFFPLRPQLKNIDLLLVKLKTKKTYAIQVKGSRTYKPQKREVNRFGEGQSCWIRIERKNIFEPTNPVDFFIFLIHLEVDGRTKRQIESYYVVISTDEFKELLTKSKKKTGKGNVYDFYIWINPRNETAVDFEEWNNTIEFTPFLNKVDYFQ